MLYHMKKPQILCHPATPGSLLFLHHHASSEKFSNHTAEQVPLKTWDFMLLGIFASFCFGLCFPKKLSHMKINPRKSSMRGEGCALLETAVPRGGWNRNLWTFLEAVLLLHFILLGVFHSEMEAAGREGIFCTHLLPAHISKRATTSKDVPGESLCPMGQCTDPPVTSTGAPPWKSFLLEVTQQWLITSMQKGEAFHNLKGLLQTSGCWMCWRMSSPEQRTRDLPTLWPLSCTASPPRAATVPKCHKWLLCLHFGDPESTGLSCLPGSHVQNG